MFVSLVYELVSNAKNFSREAEKKKKSRSKREGKKTCLQLDTSYLDSVMYKGEIYIMG